MNATVTYLDLTAFAANDGERPPMESDRRPVRTDSKRSNKARRETIARRQARARKTETLVAA